MATATKDGNDYVLRMSEDEAQAVLAAVGCLGDDFPDGPLEALAAPS